MIGASASTNSGGSGSWGTPARRTRTRSMTSDPDLTGSRRGSPRRRRHRSPRSLEFGTAADDDDGLGDDGLEMEENVDPISPVPVAELDVDEAAAGVVGRLDFGDTGGDATAQQQQTEAQQRAATSCPSALSASGKNTFGTQSWGAAGASAGGSAAGIVRRNSRHNGRRHSRSLSVSSCGSSDDVIGGIGGKSAQSAAAIAAASASVRSPPRRSAKGRGRAVLGEMPSPPSASNSPSRAPSSRIDQQKHNHQPFAPSPRRLDSSLSANKNSSGKAMSTTTTSSDPARAMSSPLPSAVPRSLNTEMDSMDIADDASPSPSPPPSRVERRQILPLAPPPPREGLSAVEMAAGQAARAQAQGQVLLPSSSSSGTALSRSRSIGGSPPASASASATTSTPRLVGLSMRRAPRKHRSPFREEVGADALLTEEEDPQDGRGSANASSTMNVSMVLPPSPRRTLDIGGVARGTGGGGRGRGERGPPPRSSFLFGDAIMAEAAADDDNNANVVATTTTTTTVKTTIHNNQQQQGYSNGTPNKSPVPRRRSGGGLGCLFPSPSSNPSPFSFAPAQTPMRNFFDERKGGVLQSPAWSGPVNLNPFTPSIEEKLVRLAASNSSSSGSPIGTGTSNNNKTMYPRSDGMFGLHGGGRTRGTYHDRIIRSGPRSNVHSGSRSRGGKRPPRRGASPPNYAISIPTLASSPPRAAAGGGLPQPRMRRSPPSTEKAQKQQRGGAVGREVSPTDVTTFPQTGCLSEQGVLPDYYQPLKGCGREGQCDADASFASTASGPAPPLPPSKARPAISRFARRRSQSKSPAPGGCASTLSPMVLVGDSNESNLDVSVLSSSSVTSVNFNRYENDFQEIDLLGKGSFGEVCRAISRLEGVLYAIKKIDARNDMDLSNKMKEIYALAALSDIPCDGAFHIVRYHQAWVEGGGASDPKRLYIQTELCDHTLVQEIEQGRLEDDIDNGERRFKLLREMCLALDVIHGNNLVHLDIKPDNIFIKDDMYKLGDFGLANAMDAGETDEGDNRYMAQEMLSFQSVDRAKCDIFSLGATMYRVCLGRELPGCGDEWNDIRKGRLDELHGTHPELKRYIAEMMHPDPGSRPTAKELLQREHLLSDQQKQLLAQQRRLQELEEQLRQTASQMPQGGLTRSSSVR